MNEFLKKISKLSTYLILLFLTLNSYSSSNFREKGNIKHDDICKTLAYWSQKKCSSVDWERSTINEFALRGVDKNLTTSFISDRAFKKLGFVISGKYSRYIKVSSNSTSIEKGDKVDVTITLEYPLEFIDSFATASIEPVEKDIFYIGHNDLLVSDDNILKVNIDINDAEDFISDLVVYNDTLFPHISSITLNDIGNMSFFGSRDNDGLVETLDSITIENVDDENLPEHILSQLSINELNQIDQVTLKDGSVLNFTYTGGEFGFGNIQYTSPDKDIVTTVSIDQPIAVNNNTNQTAQPINTASITNTSISNTVNVNVINEDTGAFVVNPIMQAFLSRTDDPWRRPIPVTEIAVGRYTVPYPSGGSILGSDTFQGACSSFLEFGGNFCTAINPNNDQRAALSTYMLAGGCEAAAASIFFINPALAAVFEVSCRPTFAFVAAACPFLEAPNPEQLCSVIARLEDTLPPVTANQRMTVRATKGEESDSEVTSIESLISGEINQIVLELPLGLPPELINISANLQANAVADSTPFNSPFPCDNAQCIRVSDSDNSQNPQGNIIAEASVDGSQGVAEASMDCTATYLSPSDTFNISINVNTNTRSFGSRVSIFQDGSTTITGSGESSVSGQCDIRLQLGDNSYLFIPNNEQLSVNGAVTPDSRFGRVSAGYTLTIDNTPIFENLSAGTLAVSPSIPGPSNFSSEPINIPRAIVLTGSTTVSFSFVNGFIQNGNCQIPTCDAQPGHTSSTTATLQFSLIPN